MGIEIERKFLVTGDGWRASAQRVVPMAQGYLNDIAVLQEGRMRASVRVRREGDAAFLNIKSSQMGSVRQEFEYAIPPTDAQALLALCVGGRIEKRRHYVEHAGRLWEVDEFLGENAGLVVAEIELESADAVIECPQWVGVEVTHLPRYYNLALAQYPYARWRPEERQAVDAPGSTSC
jgi:adenylate cyclase